MKWKGFPHEGNTWQKRKDISLELVEGFEATYQGNHLGVWLLEKPARRGKKSAAKNVPEVPMGPRMVVFE